MKTAAGCGRGGGASSMSSASENSVLARPRSARDALLARDLLPDRTCNVSRSPWSAFYKGLLEGARSAALLQRAEHAHRVVVVVMVVVVVAGRVRRVPQRQGLRRRPLRRRADRLHLHLLLLKQGPGRLEHRPSSASRRGTLIRFDFDATPTWKHWLVERPQASSSSESGGELSRRAAVC